MQGQRRVGTLTLGIFMVLFGVVFLVGIFVPLPYEFILSLWPVIFILLGAEVLLGYFWGKGEKLKYDGASFAILIVMTLFGMALAVADYALRCEFLYRL